MSKLFLIKYKSTHKTHYQYWVTKQFCVSSASFTTAQTKLALGSLRPPQSDFMSGILITL